MSVFRKKKIQKKIALFFLVAFIAQGVLGSFDVAFAQTPGAPSAQATNGATSNAGVSTTCSWYDVFCMGKDLFAWTLEQMRNLLVQYVASPAAAAFVWVVNPANVSGPNGVLNNQAVYDLWKFIRDFFNLFFILILLFSAFATIFQVESFNIRNIFKNVLLVALLINFSFPIVRFLIDATNVPMYYFINDVLGNGTGNGGMMTMNQLLGYSGISGALFFSNNDGNLAQLVMGVIFIFLFAISLFVLSAMMLIRLIALTLLLIFSPIGFAAGLLPGFKKYGHEWWEKFWSYALFGPAAALMLVVAVRFLGALGGPNGIFNSVTQVTTDVSTGTGPANAAAQVVFFTIPIILIWAAIGMANKFAIAGAGTIAGLGYAIPRKIGDMSKRAVLRGAKIAAAPAVGTAKAVGGAAATVSGVRLARDTFKAWDKSRKQAREDKEERRAGTKFGKWIAGQQDRAVGAIGTSGARDDARTRMDQEATKKVKEATDRVNMAEMMPSTLSEIANDARRDKYDRMAATQELAKKGALDMTQAPMANTVRELRNQFGETSTAFRQMNNKLKTYDPVSAFENVATDPAERQRLLREYVNTNEFDAKKLSPRSLGNVEFMRTLIQEEAASMKDLEEIAKKSDTHKRNIQDSLRSVSNAPDAGRDANGRAVPWDRTTKRHQALQEASFNMTGSLSNVVSGDPAWKREVFAKLSKDFGTSVKHGEIVGAGHMRDLAESVNPSSYKGWITSIKDKESARIINKNVLQMGTNGNANFEALKRVANDDPFLKNFS